MSANDCLIAKIGCCYIGMYSNDVGNVYYDFPKVTRLPGQNNTYYGLVRINDINIPILNFKERVGILNSKMDKIDYQDYKPAIITFRTGVHQRIGILIDKIIGFEKIDDDQICKSNNNLQNKQKNINLLLPLVARRSDGSLLHILDVSYLEKVEEIAEEASELELF